MAQDMVFYTPHTWPGQMISCFYQALTLLFHAVHFWMQHPENFVKLLKAQSAGNTESAGGIDAARF